MPSAEDFRPIPVALIDRLRLHVDELATATSTDEQIAALFLAHAEMKDAEALIARGEEAAQVAIRINRN